LKDPQSKISILIVENDFHELQVLGNSLKAFGHDLLYAITTSQAIQIVSEKKPEIILVNGVIASANNYELLSLISGQCPVTPLLIIASDATSDLIDNIQDYFWIDFIQKPLNIRKLLFRIYRHRENIFLRSKNVTREISGFSAAKSEKNVEQGFSASILLVEDHVLNQAYMMALLKRSGYQVLLAETGKEAMEKIKSYQPGLVLLDMVLPDMDGAKILEYMEASGIKATVIVLSGFSEKELRKVYPAISADAYLLKPVDPAELARQLKKYMTASAGNNKLRMQTRLYDYSHLLEITQGTDISFHDWLLKFITSLSTCREHVALVINGSADQVNPKVFHEILNYCVYFGAHDLKLKLWSLMDREIATEQHASLMEIHHEIQSLLEFYQRLSKSKDLFL
jgi:DNA-binding response OmpR family regulator